VAQSVVSSPTPAATPAATVAAAPFGTTTGYNPQTLGAGFAVLVDYASRPQVAGEIRQLLNRQIGLVSYQQRPYLLAVYTGDAAVASEILRQLSDRNYTALITDSRRVILLTPAVRIP
jgi:hypothetical protein